MKISPHILNGTPPQSGHTDRTDRSDVQTARVPGSDSSSLVALSTTARHVSQLESPSNDINMVRVEEIRHALKNGTLKINADVIADKLIASAHELLKQK